MLQSKLRPGFLWLAIAHVQDGDFVVLSHRYTTVAGDSIVAAAAVPLARVDLKLPDEAPVKEKGASLVVFITPANHRLAAHPKS